MRILTTLTCAATIAAFATSSMAGGLAEVVVEPPVEVEEVPAGSSVSPTFIIVGILAALLIAAAAQDD